MTKPLSDRIFVRPCIPKATTSGIHLPQKAQDRYSHSNAKWCDVVAAGQGKRNKKGVLIPPPAEPGDRVLCYFDQAVAVPGAENTWCVEAPMVIARLERVSVDEAASRLVECT
jgi:co-chaperonin GroES (HSP10)